MSCHNVGAALNNMVEKILEMYDENEISKDATKKLIKQTKISVNFCDGNEGETTECMVYHRCGRCLKKYTEVGQIFAVWGETEFTQRDDVCDSMLCGNCIMEINPNANLSDYI